MAWPLIAGLALTIAGSVAKNMSEKNKPTGTQQAPANQVDTNTQQNNQQTFNNNQPVANSQQPKEQRKNVGEDLKKMIDQQTAEEENRLGAAGAGSGGTTPIDPNAQIRKEGFTQPSAYTNSRSSGANIRAAEQGRYAQKGSTPYGTEQQRAGPEFWKLEHGGSDANLKENQEPAEEIDLLKIFAEKVNNYTWNYKPGSGEDPTVQHSGPMAQELLKVPGVNGAVSEGPDGYLQVNAAQASLSALGLIADLSKRLLTVEELVYEMANTFDQLNDALAAAQEQQQGPPPQGGSQDIGGI